MAGERRALDHCAGLAPHERVSSLAIKDVRISEQLAYQLLQFLERYQADVEHLTNLSPNTGVIGPYIEAMADGDRQDAERLERSLQAALERRD